VSGSSALGAREALQFVREALGPQTERALASPEAVALVLSRIRAGASLEDACLWFAHREGRSDSRIADEFVAFFLSDLLSVARPAISPGLRRFLDSGDLVQSVLGSLEFETRGSFLSYLAQRLRWKASDQRRSLSRERRREDLRVAAAPEDLSVATPSRGPESLAAARDAWEQTALAILRLPERDRVMVRMHLRGESLDSIGEAVGLKPDSVRRALGRAVRRLRGSS
jgi:RNA polymerase sigma factor (sigma-70 family)